MLNKIKKWLLPRKQRLNKFELHYGGNTKAKNILIFTEYVNATYFISFDLPLKELHAEGEINFAVVSQKHLQENLSESWVEEANNFRPDVVVFTRYGEARGPEILEYFKSKKIPVIYHIDDDLLEVPESLGAEIKKRQGNKSVLQVRRKLLNDCDLIYASTSHLAKTLKARFPHQKIFHGIYAPYMGDLVNKTPVAQAKGYVIGYMGSKGHQNDLQMVVPAIERLLDERNDVRFEVFGTIKMPKQLERFGARVSSHSVKKSYIDFLNILAKLNWDIGLAPLVDAPFNLCKAPTKYIEYTACSIPVVASKLGVYDAVIFDNSGKLVTNDDWYAALGDLLADEELKQRYITNAREYCGTEFSIDVLKKQLLTVFAFQ